MNPPTFLAELKRRNVVRVAGLYLVGAWLIVQVSGTLLPMFDAPAWVPRSIVTLLAIGFIPALVFSWAFELTPSGLKRDEKVTPAESIAPQTGRRMDRLIIAVLVLALAYFCFDKIVLTPRREAALIAATEKSFAEQPSAESNAKSIAVLPFVDMSQAKDQEYFCDGISEEILDALAKVEGLRVVARTSSFSFKGKNADVSEVANKLNVANVLEGSLRRAGNRVRITAQLINARDGFHLWSETYERELQDVFAVQDEITRAIVDALKIKLAVAPAVPASHDTEAHDLYLQGLFFSNKSDEENLRKALELFQRAVEKDPTLSRAWTGIAKVWDYLADAYVTPLDAYPHVKEAAAKAIALDERNAEAHVWFGDAIHVLDWDLAGDEREVKRALEIDPNLALAHVFSGFLRSFRGDWQGAVSESEKGMILDPLSPAVAGWAVLPYMRAGLVDKAIAAARRVSELDPNYLYRDPPLAVIYLETGRYEEALAAYTKAQEMTHSPNSGHAVAYARMGRQEDARRILNLVLEQARTRYVPGASIASVYSALGEKEEAFRWLERAYAEHDVGMYFIKSDPTFRSLQADPRFADLMRKIGLDPAPVLSEQNKK